MNGKKAIRVVKKEQRNQRQPVVQKTSKVARETARDMVQNVTNWVSEFQQKRRTETSNALKLLTKTPRPSEA